MASTVSDMIDSSLCRKDLADDRLYQSLPDLSKSALRPTDCRTTNTGYRPLITDHLFPKGGKGGCHAGAAGRISTTSIENEAYSKKDSSHLGQAWDESPLRGQRIIRTLGSPRWKLATRWSVALVS